jgi:ribonuclease Z
MNKNAIEIAKNSDLLICEASFAEEEKERAIENLHLTATDAATIAKKAKAKQLILTHISQRYEHNPEIIEKEAKKVFKNTKLAKDFDVFEI